MSEDIAKCLDEELADSFVVGPESVAYALEQGKQSVLDQLSIRRHYSLVDDVIREMECWDCFEQPRSHDKSNQSYAKAARKLLSKKQKRNRPKQYQEPYRVIKIGKRALSLWERKEIQEVLRDERGVTVGIPTALQRKEIAMPVPRSKKKPTKSKKAPEGFVDHRRKDFLIS